MSIEIHNLQTCLDVDLSLVERALLQALKGHPCSDPELSISIVDDQAIHEVNKQYLNHDYATDVIAFNYEESLAENELSGEVIVSAETALRVSKDEGHDASTELILYLVHGILHLRGFNDKSDREAEEMWEKQNQIMKALGFAHNFHR